MQTRTQQYQPYFTSCIWEYDHNAISLDSEEMFMWFLERKITYDGLRGIKKDDLAERYQRLNIPEEYQTLLNHFFHEKKHSHTSTRTHI